MAVMLKDGQLCTWAQSPVLQDVPRRAKQWLFCLLCCGVRNEFKWLGLSACGTIPVQDLTPSVPPLTWPDKEIHPL